uniref:Putative secreted protein n=1 Tax=Ixodes ricinus TaxID=34613 RepID=A0A131Y4V1_IXORI
MRRLPTVMAFSVLALVAHKLQVTLADRTMGLAVLMFALRWRLEYLLNQLKKSGDDEQKRDESMKMIEYLRKEIKYQVNVFLQRTSAPATSTSVSDDAKA